MQTEEEYIIATNRAKVSLAKTALMDCLKGDHYGIDPDLYFQTLNNLYDMEERLFDCIEIAPTEDK